MEFDADRKGSGTKEWAEVTENICLGCANNCLYCYAANIAANPYYGARKLRNDWHNEVLTKRADIKSYPAKSGVVMFPSSHDITPFNLHACTKVLNLILQKGNSVLIVTKPRWECIPLLANDLMQWRQQILFRFTIGSMNSAVTSFWEPGAPSPSERIDCLKHVRDRGFKTSISIEPMLEGIDGTLAVISDCAPYVTDTIWIGKMNKARSRVPKEYCLDVAKVEHLQRDGEILRLVSMVGNNPLIRWKDSIKEVMARQEGR